MNTPSEHSLPSVSTANDATTAISATVIDAHSHAIDPNDPPWGVTSAVLLWLASVMALFLMQALAFVGYGLFRFGSVKTIQAVSQGGITDTTLVLLLIAAVIPAHLLTLLLVWAFVTQNNRRPFGATIGWSWTEHIGLWTSVSLAVLLLIVGWFIAWMVGGGETQVDQIIKSSVAARFTTAFLATATAPLVEELVYRGVLYSALQRAVGKLWAIVGVSALFALVHFPQYDNNLGVIAAVGLLSLALTIVRALTGRLLPCFVIHLVFNGLQAAALSLEPFYRPPSTAERIATDAQQIATLALAYIVELVHMI